MLVIFDTSTTDGIVAVADPENLTIEGYHRYARNEGGTANLLIGLEETLNSNNLNRSDLTGIIVNRGPGSYTGLRVGFALAQGLAESLSLPVFPVPSYSAFAIQYRKGGMSLAVCYDARSRGIGWITYAPESSEPLRSDDGLTDSSSLQMGTEVIELGLERILLRIAPAVALPGLVPRPCRFVGPAVSSLTQQLDEAPPDDLDLVTDSEYPGLEYLLELGQKGLQGGGVDHSEMTPFYLGTIEAPGKGR